MITAIGIALCAATVFLLLAGEHASRRIRARREATAALTRRNIINARIRASRNTSYRAAWRHIRDDRPEEL